MAESPGEQKPAKVGDPRVHMANERTFMAWIRTSIGIMAFGFVVEKFAIFMKRLEYYFGRPAVPEVIPDSWGYSTIFGIVLVAMGSLMGLLAFIHYKKTEKQIEDDTYRPALILDILVTIGIIAIGIFLVFYMFHSIKS